MYTLRGLIRRGYEWARSPVGLAFIGIGVTFAVFYTALTITSYDGFAEKPEGGTRGPLATYAMLSVGATLFTGLLMIAAGGIGIVVGVARWAWGCFSNREPVNRAGAAAQRKKDRENALAADVRREQALTARVKRDVEELLTLRGTNVLAATVEADEVVERLGRTRTKR